MWVIFQHRDKSSIFLSGIYLICLESFFPFLPLLFFPSLPTSLPLPSSLLPSLLSSFLLSSQTIYRARFSSITEQAILHAFHNLTSPNWNEARSVDGRMELDLRIGCSFTRFQTTLFQVVKHIHFIIFKLLQCVQWLGGINVQLEAARPSNSSHLQTLGLSKKPSFPDYSFCARQERSVVSRLCCVCVSQRMASRARHGTWS